MKRIRFLSLGIFPPRCNTSLCLTPGPVAASCLVAVCLFATKDVIGYIFTADK